MKSFLGKIQKGREEIKIFFRIHPILKTIIFAETKTEEEGC